ncbi:MAG: hypothetical protein ABI442_09320 [Gemmatimonadaceae bacterium]
MARMYSLTVKNRVGAAVFAVAIVGLGIVFLTVGFALLAGLALVGGVLAVGFAVYNRLRGRGHALPRGFYGAAQSGLDPSLEVRPVEASVIRQLENDEPPEN